MRTLRIICVLLIAASLFGCASSQQAVDGPRPSRDLDDAASSTNNFAPTTIDQNSALLAKLGAARNGRRADFPIGPGDVLQVSVPRLSELKERTVRVDEDGNVSLPLLGSFQAAGLSEDEVRNELLKRLGKYMYHPEVDLFIKEFASREVSVLGEVHHPAMYTLNGHADTIREMIQRAGGPTDNAAQMVLFTPSAAIGKEREEETELHDSAVRDVAMVSREDRSESAEAYDYGSTRGKGRYGSGKTVAISLASGSRQERYLELPVMPGDTIYVPRAGQVTVMGWVYYPKVFPITPGMTVLGAVSAAGGPLYAGDMTSVKLIRESGGGQLSVININLNDVKKAKAPDVPVQANDVVEVSYSTLRLPGYGLYYAAQSIFTWTPAAAVMAGVP